MITPLLPSFTHKHHFSFLQLQLWRTVNQFRCHLWFRWHNNAAWLKKEYIYLCTLTRYFQGTTLLVLEFYRLFVSGSELRLERLKLDFRHLLHLDFYQVAQLAYFLVGKYDKWLALLWLCWVVLKLKPTLVLCVGNIIFTKFYTTICTTDFIAPLWNWKNIPLVTFPLNSLYQNLPLNQVSCVYQHTVGINFCIILNQ